MENQKESQNQNQNQKENQKIAVDIGLDISSSIIGICVLKHSDGSLISLNNLNLTSSKFEDLFDKIEFVKKIMNISDDWDVKNIFVEDIAKKFSVGASSADTITTLAKMNVLVCYLYYLQTGLKPIYVNVRSMRAKLGIKPDLKDKTKTTKEKVFEIVKERNSTFPWVTHISTRGKNKGEVVFDKCNQDMADSWVVCRGGQVTYPASSATVVK